MHNQCGVNDVWVHKNILDLLRKPGSLEENYSATFGAFGKPDAGFKTKFRVGSREEAISLVQEAFPEAQYLGDALPGQPYPEPPPGITTWYRIEPPEPSVGNLSWHVKYQSGKVSQGGSRGHIFFGGW